MYKHWDQFKKCLHKGCFLHDEMYFTPGNEFYTAAKPEVYIYLDYIYIEGEKDLRVFNS